MRNRILDRDALGGCHTHKAIGEVLVIHGLGVHAIELCKRSVDVLRALPLCHAEKDYAILVACAIVATRGGAFVTVALALRGASRTALPGGLGVLISAVRVCGGRVSGGIRCILFRGRGGGRCSLASSTAAHDARRNDCDHKRDDYSEQAGNDPLPGVVPPVSRPLAAVSLYAHKSTSRHRRSKTINN